MIKASLRSHLTLWFAGLSLLTLLSVGFYVGHIATEQVKQASGNTLLNTARSTAPPLRCWPCSCASVSWRCRC